MLKIINWLLDFVKKRKKETIYLKFSKKPLMTLGLTVWG